MTTGLTTGRMRRLLSMSLPEAAVRTGQSCRQLLHRLRPSVVDRIPPGSLADFDRATAPVPGLTECDAVARYLRTRAPAQATDFVLSAERLLAGEIDLLGLAPISLGDPPAWHADPVHGRTAPWRHWSRIPFGDIRMVGDCKVVWELNRHQFLLRLAQAYRLSGNRAYATRAWALINSWIDENPPEIGINWSSSLEVALRAIVWCWLWHLADAPGMLDADGRARVARALQWHGRHIESYLSTYFSPNTHLTGEALGLCYLAASWPTGPNSERWWRRGSGILTRELGSQLERDGFHFERSACYHLYTLDFYLHFALLHGSRGLPLPDPLRRGLQRMAEVVAAVIRPDGLLVNVGDEDGGRLLFLGTSAPLDPSASLALASAVLDAPHLWPERPGRYEAVWALGTAAFERAAASGNGKDASPCPSQQRTLLPSGFVVSRPGRDYVLASLGIQRRSRRCTGHVHDDGLSIELWCGGRPVFVDPGTYTYTADPTRRRWYRSASAHNAPVVDSGLPPPLDDPFRWKRLSGARLDAAEGTSDATFIDMHRPMDHTRAARQCRRVVGWAGRGWIVWDRLYGRGRRQVRARFQFATQVARREGPELIVLPGTIMAVLGSVPAQGEIILEDSPWSPRYGRLVPAAACAVTAETALPADLLVMVLPTGEGRGSVPPIARLDSGAIMGDGGSILRTVDLRDDRDRLCHRLLLAERPGFPVLLDGGRRRCLTAWWQCTDHVRDTGVSLLVHGPSDRIDRDGPPADWRVSVSAGVPAPALPRGA